MGKQILIAVICQTTGKAEYYPLTVSNLHIVIRKYLPDHHLITRKHLLQISNRITAGLKTAMDEADRLLH